MCAVYHRAAHHTVHRTVHHTVHHTVHYMRFDCWQRERTALVDVYLVKVQEATHAEERHERVVLLAHIDLAHVAREATQRVREDVPAGRECHGYSGWAEGHAAPAGRATAHRSASRGILKASRASRGSVTLCAGLSSPCLSHSCRFTLHRSSTFSSVASAT